MSNQLVDFVCIRIQSEIDKYTRTKKLSPELLDGAYTIDDIERCMKHMRTKRQQNAARALVNEYRKYASKNINDLKTALRKEYSTTMKNLQTQNADFVFPTVMSRYRQNINPARALYYDTREITRRYNSDDPRHVWLADLVKGNEFNIKLVDALEADVKRLEKIVRRYHWPLANVDAQIPLELFHARQQISDFKLYAEFFEDLLDWDPDA